MENEQVMFEDQLSRSEEEVISFFCDGCRVMGLPKSIGEIYGLLFITQEALSLDDLVERLGISKGSASQGLKFLRNLGALESEERERKTYYSPVMNLKSLVGGFIKGEILPHMESGQEKLRTMKEVFQKEEDSELKEFYVDQHEKLERWSKQAKVILPLIQRVLGS